MRNLGTDPIRSITSSELPKPQNLMNVAERGRPYPHTFSNAWTGKISAQGSNRQACRRVPFINGREGNINLRLRNRSTRRTALLTWFELYYGLLTILRQKEKERGLQSEPHKTKLNLRGPMKRTGEPKLKPALHQSHSATQQARNFTQCTPSALCNLTRRTSEKRHERKGEVTNQLEQLVLSESLRRKGSSLIASKRDSLAYLFPAVLCLLLACWLMQTWDSCLCMLFPAHIACPTVLVELRLWLNYHLTPVFLAYCLLPA